MGVNMSAKGFQQEFEARKALQKTPSLQESARRNEENMKAIEREVERLKNG